MSWAQAFLGVYNSQQEKAGIPETRQRKTQKGEYSETIILLPVSHLTAQAHIQITLNNKGEFRGAAEIDKQDALTIIPVTEKSAGRTSGPVAHPLFDNLKYVAGDYDAFVPVEKEEKAAEMLKARADYLAFLRDWCASPYGHPMARAVLSYVEKGTMVADLLAEGVLIANENGMLSTEHKVQKIEQQKAFVRFVVRWPTDELQENIWLEPSLHKSFTEYYRSQNEGEGLCYLTGENVRPAGGHPRKIRNEGDGAKLISANDTAGFTYLGRFTSDDQAVSVGYEASQKIHNALRWLIRRQGYLQDGLCILAFAADLTPSPAYYEDAPALAAQDTGEEEPKGKQEEENPDYDYSEAQALTFNAVLSGYKKDIPPNTYMHVASLDAATPGRLAFTYFQTLPASRYLKNIEKWHTTGSWQHRKWHNGKAINYTGMPSLSDIALLVYGVEQEKILKHRSSGDKAPMKAAMFARLTPCILEGRPLPRDVVRSAVMRASNPVAFNNEFNWQRVLSAACSLVKKKHYEDFKEELPVDLNENNQDRSYLYGRLLAVANKIEWDTYEKGAERETNAKRLMNMFAKRPFTTWPVVYDKIMPYFGKLSTGSRIHYENLISDIMRKFKEEDFQGNKPLDGLYLMGYYCQNAEFFKRKEEKETEQNNADNAEI